MRTRIYEIVSRPKHGDNASCLYDLLIVVVALLSIAPALFHANSIQASTKNILATIDTITVYILCFDYLLNWMTFDIAEGKRGKWREFIKYPFTFVALINLASMLPSLNLLPSGFLFLRALRIFRLFLYSRHLAVIANVFYHERKTLGSVFMLALAYIFATALIMFTFEPETFENFMDAVYWATITLTTIGFGDITPTSDLGHLLTSVSSIFGIFIFALPAGIMTGGFLQQLREREEAGDDYYAGGWLQGLNPSAFAITPKKIKAYYQANPKVRLYLISIIFGISLNYLLCLIFSEFYQPLWLDTTGTALVACALDPAAGVIVSFVNNLIIAVYQESPQSILYFSESALVALTYGFLFKQTKDGKLPYRNAGKVLITIIVVQCTITVFLAFFLNNGYFTTIFQNGYRDFFVEQGVDYYASCFFACFIDRILDAPSVFLIVVLILKFLRSKGFVARKWLDEHCTKTKVSKKKQKQTRQNANDPNLNTGILSCSDEAITLSRSGLRSIAISMREEASKTKDTLVKQSYLSSADTISLLLRTNVKSEDDFKKLLDEKMEERQNQE